MAYPPRRRIAGQQNVEQATELIARALQRRQLHMQSSQNAEQATELIENGFEYVTEIDGIKLFRKRK